MTKYKRQAFNKQITRYSVGSETVGKTISRISYSTSNLGLLVKVTAMGSGTQQNVRFLWFFIVLGAGIVLTFIYASCNSNISGLPHLRSGTPELPLPLPSLRNISIIFNKMGTTWIYKNNNVGKQINVTYTGQETDEYSAPIKYRQPAIDVLPRQSEMKQRKKKERLLQNQLFADNNFSSNSNLQQLAHVPKIGGSKKNVVFYNNLMSTLSPHKFTKNARGVVRSNAGVQKTVYLKDVHGASVESVLANKSSHLPNFLLISKNENVNISGISANEILSTALNGISVDLDPVQGILTIQIYEGGHRNEEINIENICPDGGRDLKLLIMITSEQSHQEARLAIRQTWGHYATRRDTAIVFILGRTTNETLDSLLTQENFIYSDLIRGRFLDTYNNLTLKTISALEWADRHCAKAKHILKTDDDMFINVPKLLLFVENHAHDKHVIYGRLAKKWKPIRNKKSKYYVSPEQFSPTVFPSFTTGPAYMMSADIIHGLYVRALQHTYLKLEDVFTTGILAQQLGVKRVQVNEFLNRRIAFNSCNIRKAFSIHMIKANEQFDLWKKLLDQSIKCK